MIRQLLTNILSLGQSNGDDSKKFSDYFATKLPQWCKDKNTTKGFRDLYWYERKTIRRIHRGVPLAEALQKESQLVGTAHNIDEDAESQDEEDFQGDGPESHKDFSYDGEVSAKPQAKSSSMGVYNPVRGMPLGTKRQHIEIVENSDNQAEQPQQRKRKKSGTGFANREIPRSREGSRLPRGNGFDASKLNTRNRDIPIVSQAKGILTNEKPEVSKSVDQQVRHLESRAAQSTHLERTQSTSDSKALTDSAIFSGYAPIYLQVGIPYTSVRVGTRAAQQVVVTSVTDRLWKEIDLTSLLQELQEFEGQSRVPEKAKNESAAARVESIEPETFRYFLTEGDTYIVIRMDNKKTHKGVRGENDYTWVEQDLEATIQDIQSIITLTQGARPGFSAHPQVLSPHGDSMTNVLEASESHRGTLAGASVSQSPISGVEAEPILSNEHSARVLP